jgi:hypothetical protein
MPRSAGVVFYMPTAIYFGVRAHAAPGTAHATLAPTAIASTPTTRFRSSSTLQRRQAALVFAVNPLGMQADGALVEGSGNRGGALFSALESGREVTDLTPDTSTSRKGG